MYADVRWVVDPPLSCLSLLGVFGSVLSLDLLETGPEPVRVIPCDTGDEPSSFL